MMRHEPPTAEPATYSQEKVDPGTKISARGIVRTFTSGNSAVHALGPVDLEIGSGEFVCIVGPSGCGKSTLLRIIAGLLAPSSGEILLSSSDDSPLASVVFQDYSIYPWKTVAANVRFGLDILGIPRKEANRRVDDVLRRLGLQEFSAAYPAALSGGMRQRVSIARALVTEPQILLMDEPFAALDAQMRHILQDELLELWQEERRTVVFITHNLDEALVLGDRVLVMGARPGRIVGEFDVPFDRPRNGDVRKSADFTRMEGEIWELLRTEVGDRLGRSAEVAS